MNSYRHHTIKLLSLLILASALAGAAPCSTASAAKPKKTTNTAKTSTRTSGKSSGKSSGKTSGKSSGRRRAASQPKTSAEARRLQEAAQQDIRQTKEKIRLNDQEIKESLADLNLLSSEIKTGRAKVSDLNRKVTSLQNEIGTLGENIARNEAELQRMRDEYLKAVKKMRLNSKNQSMLAFIFSSKDFNQAMRRFRYMRQFSKWKESKSEEINVKIEQLGEEKDRLAKAREAHSASLSQLNASQRELESKHQKQQRLVEGLRQNGTALQNHLSQKQSEANRLKESIAQLIAQEQAKAEAERAAREKAEREAREKAARERAEAERIAREKAEAEQKLKEAASADDNKNADDKKKAEADRKKAEKEKKKAEADRKKAEKEKKKAERTARKKRNKDKKQDSASPAESSSSASGSKSTAKAAAEAYVPSGNFAALRGKLPRPVEGSWRVTNPFGRHAMPELPDVVYDNPGIDAEVAKGSSVKAVAEGKVSGVYKVQGYGSVVIVNHGEYYTVYGNLASVAVAVGNKVSAGKAVGTAAADPDDSRRGSVHFELWHGREKQNPESWLR